MSRSARLLNGLKTSLIYVLILLLASFLGNLWLTRNQVGGPAPGITGEGMDGAWHTIDVADYNRPMLLYFFADWCPICKLQHDAVQSISEDYPVVAIAMQSGDLANVKNYVQAQEFTFRVLNDEGGHISRRFGVSGVPATFIIDSSANIHFSTRGYTTSFGLLGRLWIARISQQMDEPSHAL